MPISRRNGGIFARGSAAVFWPFTISVPARRALDQRDQLEQRALAGAGVTGQEHHLAALDVEREVAERLAAVRVALADVVEADHAASPLARGRATARRRRSAPASNTPKSSADSPMPMKRIGSSSRVGDREHDAALGRAVELGEHEARDAERLRGTAAPARARSGPGRASSTSSTSCGAAGSRRPSTRFTFLSSSIRLLCVCRRPAVSAISTSAPRACADCSASKMTAAGSAPARLRDHRHAVALAPDLQLLDRGGAERVARREHDLAALVGEAARELADRRGLAGAVDADDEDHERARRRVDRRAAARPAAGSSSIDCAQRLEQRLEVAEFLALRRGRAGRRGSSRWSRCRRRRRSGASRVRRARASSILPPGSRFARS